MSGPAAPALRLPGFRRNLRHLIPPLRQLATTLESCSADELKAETSNVRNELTQGSHFAADEVIVAGIALAAEAFRRSHGVSLYDVQLLAAMHLVRGRVAQMQTGEGKTFVAIATAAHLSLCGRGVHVMTPNSYLAERDSETARDVLGHLGLTVGMTPEQGEPEDKREAYDCDVTYGTGHEFGFDYLRDQLTLRDQAAEELGSRILQKLKSTKVHRATMQRGLHFAVVDEADSVMFDDAASPLVLSMGRSGAAPDQDAHLRAMELIERFQPDREYRIHESSARVELTDSGAERCYNEDVDIPVDVLLRPWTAYVEQALRARFLFRRDIHYIVAEDEVRIVDQTTGRIFEDRSWQDGLHQAIEAREGLTVTPEKESLARITRQRFFRLYRNLCGMTGTAVGCEAEFRQVYRCEVAEIPLHRPSRRTLLPTRFFIDRSAKLNAIAADTETRHKNGQPVLIGTQSIFDSDAIAERLGNLGIEFELLNGLQTKEEAEIVATAGRCGAVTIATNLAGRGTDISISAEAMQRGGLHVIVAECQLSNRMDRQLIGRSGRQGQVGSAQVFVSADDSLIVRFGEWLGIAIRRESVADESDADFSRPIRRLQLAAEKQEFLARTSLLRQDMQRDQLFGQS